MKKGKLANGFEYEVDEMVLDDMELLDAVAEAQDENPLKISQVITMVLGKEQKRHLYDHIRNENGRVPTAAAIDAIMELFEALGDDGKN